MANTLKFGDGNWATQKDSVLAYNDENNNFKPLPFDFTRASTATYVDSDGLIKNAGKGEARIDYKDNTEGALLLEPARSNLVLASASGTYGNSPASETNTISPDGTNNAVIPTPDASSDRYQDQISGGTYSNNTKLTYSWYRKRISTPNDTSYIGDLNISTLVNSTRVGSTTQIESDVNGFDRFQAIFNITDGSALSLIRAYFGSIVGVGNSSVAYWGHQLEVGSYATSYIPTQGSTVTRVADSCSQTLTAGIIGQTEGTVFLDLKLETLDLTSRYLSIENSSSVGNGWMGVFAGTSSGNMRFRFYGDGWDFTSTLIIQRGTSYKVAFSYKDGVQTAVYVNGNLIGNLTASLSGKSFQKIRLSEAAIGVRGDADFNDVKLYTTALTNTELAKLTQA